MRSEPTTWQRTAERPPTKDDASGEDEWRLCVSAKTKDGKIDTVNWENVSKNPEAYPEWRPR